MFCPVWEIHSRKEKCAGDLVCRKNTGFKAKDKASAPSLLTTVYLGSLQLVDILASSYTCHGSTANFPKYFAATAKVNAFFKPPLTGC